MVTWCVRLFGRFCAQCGEQTLDGLEANKTQELLSYLLIHRDRPQPRELLADVLWTDSPGSQSKKHLRQVLWHLNSALSAHVDDDGSSLLLVDAEWIRVNPAADLWLDVSAFEQAFTRVQGVAGSALDPLQSQMLRDAVVLYRGDLLEGCYQDWCLLERERLRTRYLTGLDKLMDCCESVGDFETALDYGSRILSYDQARECTHRRLMRLHYLAGDRTAALRQYERCAEILRLELAVEPAASTVALHQQIRQGRLARPVSSSQLLSRLQHIQILLGDVQHQLQGEIQALQQTRQEYEVPLGAVPRPARGGAPSP
jgi:DNA-binding SARP family transcriptional activator